MSEGLQTTFRVLSTSENDAAVRVLVPALDSPYPAIRDAALEALLARRSTAGHREILRRLDTLDERWQEIIGARPGRMIAALREAVLGDDLHLATNACRAAVWYREYELIPALITVLEDPVHPASDLAGKTLTELVELFCDELASSSSRPRRDPQLLRAHLVGSLELSIQRYVKHRRREVVEALVLLAPRDNGMLQQVLGDPHHAAFVTLLDVLGKSPHPQAIRLLSSFLDVLGAPSAALSVIFKRCDVRFLDSLLHRVGRELTETQKRNSKRVQSVAWLKNGGETLENLDEHCQSAAVLLIAASNAPREMILDTLRRLLRTGQPEGRKSAVQALETFQGSEVNQLVLAALDDTDPQVQALALVQLRRRGLPGALLRLVELLDSPHAIVRRAARKSLAEFSFVRFLAAFDMLDDEVRRSTGALVKKVDPQTLPLLRAEIESPLPRRRLRGLKIAEAIDAWEAVENSVVQLLSDEDHVVRAAAADALTHCGTPSARQALAKAVHDRSPSVQEAARQGLVGEILDPRD